MALAFTPEQQRVIDIRNRNVLVSAAAGSGKTAVLVERIVKQITDQENPVDIDRLLVVTFTSAAASEMRERISQAIENRLEQQPENGHLQRQAALLHNAQITTIDSFCLFVLRNHFNEIGLDPGFRVGDEGECRLLKQDTLEAVFEEYFAAADTRFFRCVESFSQKGSDKPLGEIILKLYEFSMSFPYPEDFLQQAAADYQKKTTEEMTQTAWFQSMMEHCRNLLSDAAERLEAALRSCQEPDGPYMFAEVLEADQEQLMLLLKAEQRGMDELSAAFGACSFGRLPSRKDDSVSIQKREQVKQTRQLVKDLVKTMSEEYFFKPFQEMTEDMNQASGLLEMLSEITMRFMEKFSENKREKNIIDFHDMEHFALQILLTKADDGTVRASRAARDYRDYFREILIDEYQDSNLVQEALLSSVSGEEEGCFNRFMVGDVKQSIYKFRLARPELFMEKYDTYDSNNGQCVRIDLHKNFRSRQEIIDSVNRVFGKIMSRKLGRVAYDSDAALYQGAAYETQDSDYRTEVLLYEGSEKGREEEAAMIGAKIRDMVGRFQVTDRQTGKLRPAAYRDIVILLRTNSGWDDVFQKVLTESGIPVYAASKAGYFQTVEIQTLLNLLKVLDNPQQDIPLYGVLTSSFGGMTEEDMAHIRTLSEKKHERLYVLLKKASAEAGRTGEKAGQFLEFLRDCRKKTACMPIQKLIQDILMNTGYLHLTAAMPGGEQRQSNVEMLLSRAADFEKTSYYGLFHFIRYIEQMERYAVDYGEASILDENADTVRIMSIHKSKGLEFPICFVAGLSKPFHRRDTSQPLLMDVDLGLGAEYADCDARVRQTTLKKNAVSAKIKSDNIGEELRVLYVAMTRAKEKMILTASVADYEKEEAKALGAAGRRLSFTELYQAGCYLDMLLPAVMGEPEFQISMIRKEELLEGQAAGAVQAEVQKQQLLYAGESGLLMEEGEETRQLREHLDSRFSFCYPHENLRELVTKTTVSELKKAGMEESMQEGACLYENPQPVPCIPRFAGRAEQEKSGADRGSAFHKVMELLDFQAFSMLEQEEARREELKRQLEIQEKSGRLSAEYRSYLELDRLLHFLRTPLAKQMGQAEAAGSLYREQPFVLGLPANRLKPEFPYEETILIQGIIDAYYEWQGELVVVDYKTDRVPAPEELIRRYQAQLDYYSEAVETILCKKNTRKIIYSFHLGLEIVLK